MRQPTEELPDNIVTSDIGRVILPAGTTKQTVDATMLANLEDSGVEIIEDIATAPKTLAEANSDHQALLSIPDDHVLTINEAVMPAEDFDGEYSATILELELTDRDGKWKGGIDATVIPERSVLKIDLTHPLSPTLRGKGVGLEMYNRLLAEAESRGLAFESDVIVSEEASHVYEALRRRGLDVRKSEGITFNEVTGDYVADGYDRPVYRVDNPRAVKLRIADLTDTGFDPAATAEENHFNLVNNTVERAASRINLGGKIAGGVNVVRSTADLPEFVTNAMKSHGAKNFEGVFLPGENAVYLVADSLRDGARAEQVLLHEAVAHGGLRAVFGKQMDSVLDDIWARGDQTAIKALASKYGGYADYGTSSNSRRALTEEYVAHIAETINDTPVWFDRMVLAIQKVLADIGLGSWRRAEVIDMLKRVRTSLETPSPRMITNADTGEPMFALSDEQNKRERDLANKINATKLISGDEELSIPEALATETGTLLPVITEVGLALQQRTLKANRGRNLTAHTPRNERILTQALVTEVRTEMERDGKSATWFTEKVDEAMEIMSVMHPEIVVNANSRAAFILSLALTSNQSDVKTNLNFANKVYEGYKRNGKFLLTTAEGHIAKKDLRVAFKNANRIIDRIGETDFYRLMSTEFTVKQLRAIGVSISGELAETVVNGSATFGPKIGGGFYQNLMGNFKPVTIDRWMMRTWGRLTGTVLKPDWHSPATEVDNFLLAVEDDRARLETFTQGKLDSILKDPIQRIRLAKELAQVSDDVVEYSPRVFTAAEELYAKVADSAVRREYPTSGKERSWMRNIVGNVVAELQQTDMPEITPAQVQAILWFPEKRLYERYDAADKRAAPTDYAEEATRLVYEKQNGPDTYTPGQRSGVGGKPAPNPELGQVPQQSEDDTLAGLGRKTSKSLSQSYVVKNLRSKLARGYKVGTTNGKMPVVRGVKAVRKYNPEVKLKNAHVANGLAAPGFAELPATTEGAQLFHDLVVEAKNASWAGAAVTEYVAEEYATTRMFITDDGTTGFALKGNELISGFSISEEPTFHAAMALGIAEGAKRLDVFNTVVAKMYSAHGFRSVARVPWSDERKPAGWNKDTFKRFNNGEPDVVYVALDPMSLSDHDYSDGPVTNVDEAERLQLKAVAEWSQNPGPEALFSLSDKGQKIVDADPNSEAARLHKLSGLYAADSGHRRDNPWDMVNEKVSSTVIKTTLAAVPRRALVDFIPERLAPSIKKYIRIRGKAEGRKNELQQEHGELVIKWRNWARSNKDTAGTLAEVMHVSTLIGQDPSKPYVLRPGDEDVITLKETPRGKRQKANHAYLEKAFKLLPAKAQELYTEVRDSYVDMRTGMEQALIARIREETKQGGKALGQAVIDDIRRQFEAAKVQGPYFPLSRYGDLWASAKNDKGVIVAFSRFETENQRNQWLTDMKDIGHTVDQGRKIDDVYDMVNSINPQFVKQIQDRVENEEIKDEVWQLYLRTMPEMSVRRHFIHRKGRLGFSTAALRNYANFASHSAAQQSRLEYGKDMNHALADLKTEIRTLEQNREKYPDHERWAAPLFNELNARHVADMSPDTHPLSSFLTALGFDWFLTASPAAAAVNLTQVPLVTFPIAAAKYGPIRAMRELLKAPKDMAVGSKFFLGMEGIRNKLKKTEPALAEAFWQEYKNGSFGHTQAHELASLGASSTIASTARISQAHRIAATGFHNAEVFNRAATYIAGYRLAQQAKESDPDVAASELTWDSHFDYTRGNRPIVLQGNTMRVLTLFMQYSMNIMYRLVRSANDSIRGETKERRQQMRKELAGYLTMGFMFTGFMGMPAVISRLVPWVVETLMTDEEDDDPFDATDSLHIMLAKHLGETPAKAIMYGGIDALTPASVSDRLSLANLFTRDAYPLASEQQNSLQWWVDRLGPVPAAVIDAGKGVSEMARGDYDKGLERMVPKGIRDILKARRLQTEGYMSSHIPPREIIAKEDLGPADIISQLLGFRPSKAAFQQRENIAIKKVEHKLEERRAQLMDKYFLASSMGDEEGVAEALKEINRWAGNHPAAAIGIRNIIQATRQRYKNIAMSQSGVLLPKHLWHLYSDMNIHNIEEED